MNYCWKMRIEGNSHQSWNGLKIAALALPPASDDPRVFLSRPQDYKVNVGTYKNEFEEDIEYVDIEVRFDTEEDATEFFDNARGLNGIFVACDAGYTHVHECYRTDGEGNKLSCRIIPGKEVIK